MNQNARISAKLYKNVAVKVETRKSVDLQIFKVTGNDGNKYVKWSNLICVTKKKTGA